jgi:hypothetical protein
VRVACAAGETLTLFGRVLDLNEWASTLPLAHVVEQLCDGQVLTGTISS